MSPRLGPIVGVAGPSEARLVVDLPEGQSPVLELREDESGPRATERPDDAAFTGLEVPRGLWTRASTAPAASHRVHCFTATGLDSGKRYCYRLTDAGTGAEIADTRGRFRPVPRDVAERESFLLVSCNRPDAYGRAALYESVWNDVAGELDADPSIRFVLHGGDQVYCDEAWNAIGDAFRRRFNGWTRPAQQWARENREAWKEMYRRFYHDAWRPIAARRVLRSVPNLMMWDDHDIHDGYGSRDTDAFPWLRAIYDVAREVFEEFQASLNPPANLGEGNYGFATGLLGSRFVVLDTRSRRETRTLAVLGESQLAALEDLLRRSPDDRPLFLTSSTPLFSLVDLGRVADFIVRRFGALLVDAQDDYLDGWNTEAHRGELRRILRALQDGGRRRRSPVVVLSGDIHVHHLLEFRLGASSPPMHQIVSSPLTTRPQGELGLILFPRAPQAVELLAAERGTPGVRGALLGLNNQRGYAKVVLERNDEGGLGIEVQYRVETEPGGPLQPWPASPVALA